MMARETVVVEAVRTAVGKRGGTAHATLPELVDAA
jgi:hypothetical protein